MIRPDDDGLDSQMSQMLGQPVKWDIELMEFMSGRPPRVDLPHDSQMPQMLGQPVEWDLGLMEFILGRPPHLECPMFNSEASQMLGQGEG
jgi:hypothetical protein